jgi:hypothetical protein
LEHLVPQLREIAAENGETIDITSVVWSFNETGVPGVYVECSNRCCWWIFFQRE